LKEFLREDYVPRTIFGVANMVEKNANPWNHIAYILKLEALNSRK
jgi:hypothetical protein